jgi:hypothetical protein
VVDLLLLCIEGLLGGMGVVGVLSARAVCQECYRL